MLPSKMVLEADQAFLDTGMPSGSTGTMCIVRVPANGGSYQLVVVNSGDSRVLLGRCDGSIVDGGGTDKGLTTDHKPDHPAESERIYRCGGFVQSQGGVARVNGDLAVSRGFGDADLKCGGPGPEDHPVIASPEIGHFECEKSDFLLLVCDGVSEGDFPNAEVVKFVADSLSIDGDPGAAARKVCHQAVEANSKDNVTCMVVLLNGSERMKTDRIEFTPGPLTSLSDTGFLNAYEAMAEKAGFTLESAIRLRYDNIKRDIMNHPELRADLEEELDLLTSSPGIADATSNDEKKGSYEFLC